MKKIVNNKNNSFEIPTKSQYVVKFKSILYKCVQIPIHKDIKGETRRERDRQINKIQFLFITLLFLIYINIYSYIVYIHIYTYVCQYVCIYFIYLCIFLFWRNLYLLSN